MFKNVEALHPEDHAHLKVKPIDDFRFAQAEAFSPIVHSEIAEVAREFPLVFVRDTSVPVAMMGLEHKFNAYVGEDGSWLARYIPGRLRAYPFVLAPLKAGGDEFAIGCDVDSAFISEQEGDALFDQQGAPSAALKARVELLKNMKKEQTRTVAMVKALREFGVLEEKTLRFNRPDGGESQMGGIEVIDEAALNKLSLKQFGQLRDMGLLPLVYAHLLSMINLNRGVLADRYPAMADRHTAAES